ncbi:MAG: IS91 family transposase [Granulosicoccus sp.]
MSSLEVADIFCGHGSAYRAAHKAQLSLRQLKAMSAIERCRTAVLGGHVLRCTDCSHTEIAYNSCRNRHCPKCQASAAHRWLQARELELLPVEYYHVVFTLPSSISDLAFQNPAVVYNILFKAASKTLLTIAADPKHLGARIGLTAVLHTWGSAMTHHPHVHCIVPGGGLSIDGQRWVACKKGFFLPVRVLSRLFRRLFLEQLIEAHRTGRLEFHGSLLPLNEFDAFEKALQPTRKLDWVVYAKRPFHGPKAVLNYLSRYTHRVAIANSRLLSTDGNNVTFKWKDYRRKSRDRYSTMTLDCHEFIRRFLIHILPSRFHRIRHYGFLSNTVRAEQLHRVRKALDIKPLEIEPVEDDNSEDAHLICKHCAGTMRIIEVFEGTLRARAPPVLATA